MPSMPTPVLAPWIITASPALKRPAVTSALCMVCSPTGSVAACAQVMLLAGIGTVRPQSAVAYSPHPWTPVHMTGSPGFTLETSRPVSTTSPTYSMPGTVPAPPARPCDMPLATMASARFKPQARTFIKTSAGPGFGVLISLISRPFSPTTAAFMSALPFYEESLASSPPRVIAPHLPAIVCRSIMRQRRDNR